MDKKEARKILGVPKQASRREIERKYAILLKKHRQEKFQREQYEQDSAEEDIANTAQAGDGNVTGHDPAGLEYDFELITEAYNTLMGYHVRVKEEPPGKLAMFLKKFGFDEKKTDHFFHYYKYHILAAVLIIIFMVTAIGSCTNKVEYDFNIAFIGDMYLYESVDALKKSIKENIPAIAEPGIDSAYIADSGAGQQHYAMEMKAMTLLYAGDIDVFIVNRTIYERYAKVGAFMSLDEIAPELGIDVSGHQDLILAVEDIDDLMSSEAEGIPEERKLPGNAVDTDSPDKPETDTVDTDESGQSDEKHLYGIYITDSKALKEAGVIADEMIAAIFAGCQQQEKAEEFLKFLLK